MTIKWLINYVQQNKKENFNFRSLVFTFSLCTAFKTSTFLTFLKYKYILAYFNQKVLSKRLDKLFLNNQISVRLGITYFLIGVF